MLGSQSAFRSLRARDAGSRSTDLVVGKQQQAPTTTAGDPTTSADVGDGGLCYERGEG